MNNLINKISKWTSLISISLLLVCFSQCRNAKEDYSNNAISNEIIELKIKPSTTDSTITNTDAAHYIKYNPSTSQGKLLLFLPGTNGIPERGPKQLFDVAIDQGYIVINLSYINKQAVAGICRGENLLEDSECTSKFRDQRIFGTQLTSLIPDKPQDAIVNRFVKLLQHLHEIDSKRNWDKYLDGDKPKWNIITISGQSQGGGMAAFIAKKRKVNRIINFSGGWDFSKKGKIAKWYSSPSVTPPDRWFGIYHTKERMADVIAESYKAMAIPENHIFPLDLEVREGKKAHGEGIRNIAYKKMWLDLFK